MEDNSWRLATLGEEAELLTGHPFKSGKYTNDSNGIVLLRGDNIAQGYFRWEGVKRWSASNVDNLDEYFLRPNDIVIAMDRPWIDAGLKYAAVSKYDLPCLLVQRVTRLRARSLLDSRFLRYLIANKDFTNYILGVQTGTCVPHISSSQIKDYCFLSPRIHEQRRIGTILGCIDDKIDVNYRINRTLEQIMETLFKRWFTDFEFPNEDGKPYKSSGGEMIVSESQRIPEGWRIGKLAECVSVLKGCSYKSADLNRSEIALVTLKSINRGGGFNQDGYKEYTGGYDESQVVRNGEIVVAQTDLTQKAEVIGRPAMVTSSGKYSKLVASLDLQIVRPKDNYPRSYIYYLMKTNEFHNHALSYANGTTVLHLNKNAIPEFVCPVPSKQVLNIFGKVADTILTKISFNAAQIYTLSLLRDSLLPKLMSGKIRVPKEVG
jgi:type I restriction enzyme S subunit